MAWQLVRNDLLVLDLCPELKDASFETLINCRWPARQRPTTLRLCGSGAAQLVARRPICTWWAIHTPAAHRPCGTGSR
jgi:hypothetical protein